MRACVRACVRAYMCVCVCVCVCVLCVCVCGVMNTMPFRSLDRILSPNFHLLAETIFTSLLQIAQNKLRNNNQAYEINISKQCD